MTMNRSSSCLNCGHDSSGEGPPSPHHCGHCPPWRCEDCGETSSATSLCSCWTDLTVLPLADIKALLAANCEDLSLGGAT